MALPKKVQLLPYLAQVCQEHREASDVSPLQVAVLAGYRAGTSITRDFEETHKAWPTNPDAVLMAYAQSTNMSVFDLWDEAIQRARREKADLRWLADEDA